MSESICHYCGKPTDDLAGSPLKWPLKFPHKDEPGKMREHHTGCVIERLIERDSLKKENEELRQANADANLLIGESANETQEVLIAQIKADAKIALKHCSEHHQDTEDSLCDTCKASKEILKQLVKVD